MGSSRQAARQNPSRTRPRREARSETVPGAAYSTGRSPRRQRHGAGGEQARMSPCRAVHAAATSRITGTATLPTQDRAACRAMSSLNCENVLATASAVPAKQEQRDPHGGLRAPAEAIHDDADQHARCEREHDELARGHRARQRIGLEEGGGPDEDDEAGHRRDEREHTGRQDPSAYGRPSTSATVRIANQATIIAISTTIADASASPRLAPRPTAPRRTRRCRRAAGTAAQRRARSSG